MHLLFNFVHFNSAFLYFFIFSYDESTLKFLSMKFKTNFVPLIFHYLIFKFNTHFYLIRDATSYFFLAFLSLFLCFFPRNFETREGFSHLCY